MLWTKEDIAKTPPLYTNEDKKAEDVPIVFKMFHPFSSFRFYITEANFEEELAFGYVTSHMCPEGELGYISLEELRNTKVMGLPMERDMWFSGTLAEVMEGKKV